MVLDRLVIPPGMDVDNLILQVDMNSEEYLINDQLKRKHPQTFMYEKSFNVKKGAGGDKSTIYWVQNGAQTSGQESARNNFKKDAGYTLTTTPVFYDPARDAARAESAAQAPSSFDPKELLQKLGFESDSAKKIELHGMEDSSIDQIKEIISQVVDGSKDQVNLEGIKIMVNLPKEWMKRVDKLPTKALQEAEVIIKRYGFLVSFVFDFMTYTEHSKIMKNQAFHERYFDAIIPLFKSKLEESSPDFFEAQTQIVQAMYFFALENEQVAELVKLLFDYYKIFKEDAK